MLAVALTLCGLTVNAADIFYSDEHYDYELNGEKTLYISAGRDLKGDVTLPSKVKINGEYYTVTGIHVNVIIESNEITGLTIPGTLTYIDYPYHEHVGENYGLRKVIFEDSDESISVPGSPLYPLFGHTSVEYVYIGREISYPFDYRINIEALTETVAFVLNCAPFLNLHALTTVEFGDGVTQIPHGLFGGCDNLSVVKLPKNLKYIGVSSFYGCAQLKALDIPDSVEKIEAGAFINCGLEVQKLPDALRAIGTKAFYNCKTLSKVDMPARVDSIYPWAFGKCDMHELRLPETLEYLGQYAFEGNMSLETINLPAGLKIWPAGVFKDCRSLASVQIPAIQDTIFKDTFLDCTNLSLEIPPTVNVIEYKACKGIKRLALLADAKAVCINDQLEVDTLLLYRPLVSGNPGSIPNINPRHLVFGNQNEVPRNLCSLGYNLESVFIEEGVEAIRENAFKSGTVKYVNLPSSLAKIGSKVFQGKNTWAQGEAVYIFNRPTPPEIANDAFIDVSAIRLEVPKGSYAAYRSAWPYLFREIYDGTVYSLSFPASRYEIMGGDTLRFDLKYSPEELPFPPLVWTSSDPEVASVDDNGVVIGHARGSATITVQSTENSYAKASVDIRVENRPIEKIVLSAHNITMPYGSDTLLTAQIFPEAARNTPVSWTYSGEVRVDDKGLVTAPWSIGDGQVVAYYSADSAVADTCYFKVTAAEINVSADTLVFELNADKKRQRLTVETKPSSASSKVVWSIDDPEIAEIDDNGYVTPKGLGETTVIAGLTDGSGLTAECRIVVKATPVTSITLNRTTLSLPIGEVGLIKATVNPSTAYNTELTYTVSDDIIAVDDKGYVTALSAGEADVTVVSVSNPEVTAVCHVTVSPVLAESLYLDPEEWSSEYGMTFKIEAYVSPENTTDKTLLWTSSNPDVAEVDGEGNVTLADVDGNCVITARTTDGSNLYAECHVTTYAGLTDITVDEADFDLYDLRGILLRKDCDATRLRQMSPGTYIIRRGSSAAKVVVR